MKKRIFRLVVLMSIFIFTSCTNKNDCISVVCTIYPQYDFVNKITTGLNNYSISLILDGSDAHSYQPTIKDVASINDSDLLIYIGGESEEWVREAIKTSNNKELQTISYVDILGDEVLDEEIIDGMESSLDNDDHDEEIDEHVWLSLKNSIKLCNEIYKRLSLLDTSNKEKLKENKDNYITQLENLDKNFSNKIQKVEDKVLLFADRFPFRYFVEDYGLTYFAAFNGCSTEVNASTKTITFLSSKVNEYNLKYIFILEKSNDSIANSVISSSKDKNQEILRLDTFEHVLLKDYNERKIDYLGVMESNIDLICKSLGL